MNASQANILKLIAGGIFTKMTCSYFVDEACAGGVAVYPDLEYMLEHFVVHKKTMIGDTRPWFDCESFEEKLGDDAHRPRIRDMLITLSNYDLTLCDVWKEAAVDQDDLRGNHEKHYAARIANDEIQTFTQFFESSTAAKKRWRKLRVASIFLELQASAAITANHPVRKRKRGEFIV